MPHPSNTVTVKTVLTSLLALVLLLVYACSVEDEYAINTTTVNLYPTGTMALMVSPADGGWVYSSDNNNIASVSATGIITGNHTGTTTVRASNVNGGYDAMVEVIVNAINTLYREPRPDYYVSDSLVKAYETRELVSSGNLMNGTSYLLFKPDNFYHKGIMYFFNENNQYFMSEVIVDYSFKDKLNTRLNDRYIPLHTYSNELVSFLSPDSTALVYRKIVTDTYMNIYLPIDYSGPVYTYSWSIF